MSKVLIGIAVVITGLALSISIGANAATAQTQGAGEQQAQTPDQGLQRPNINLEMLDGKGPANIGFPLMLPQPTRIFEPNRYGLG